MPELIPVQVYIGRCGIEFFDNPPGSVGFEKLFDQRTVVAFPHIENVTRDVVGH